MLEDPGCCEMISGVLPSIFFFVMAGLVVYFALKLGSGK